MFIRYLPVKERFTFFFEDRVNVWNLRAPEY